MLLCLFLFLSGEVSLSTYSCGPVEAEMSTKERPLVILQSPDNLMPAIIEVRDFQACAPTPVRIWAVPEAGGVFATMFCSQPAHLRWNFYQCGIDQWAASDTGFLAYEPAGYGNLAVNFASNSYQYFPIFNGHEYVTGDFWPDLWWPTNLNLVPFSWNGDYQFVQGWHRNRLDSKIATTQSGKIHVISTHGDNYNILYTRLEDMENPQWSEEEVIDSNSNGCFYGIYGDPFGKTVVVTYTRTSSDNHLILLIDTLEGDMFLGGNSITIDVSEELAPMDTLNIAFVANGIPFVDRDGNVHSFLIGSNGSTIVPLDIWHFFYDPSEDTTHFTLVETVSGEVYHRVGINSLIANRVQMGQNRENGNLYAVWEEFIQEPDWFLVNSTGDTFAPCVIKMGRSTDNGLSWETTTLAQPLDEFENHWLRFPVISPTIYSSQVGDSLFDCVVWGFYDDYDPGFAWQAEGVDSVTILWVGFKEVFDTVTVAEKDLLKKNSRLLSIVARIDREGVGFITTSDGVVRLRLKLYTSSGRLVKELHKERLLSRDEIHWNLRDERGLSVASGVYLYVAETKDQRLTGKFVVTK